MTEDTAVELRQPGAFSEDSLTEILRLGARPSLAPSSVRFQGQGPFPTARLASGY